MVKCKEVDSRSPRREGAAGACGPVTRGLGASSAPYRPRSGSLAARRGPLGGPGGSGPGRRRRGTTDGRSAPRGLRVAELVAPSPGPAPMENPCSFRAVRRPALPRGVNQKGIA